MSYLFFSESEFKRACPSCSLSDMNEEFMLKLDRARLLCKYPFVINSAYRSREYELSKGRSGTSSHCKGVAVDLKCVDSSARLCIVQCLFLVGFTRIGIGSTFIHVDSDPLKHDSLWLY